MMLLSGCSTKTETEYRLPPSIYLIPCPQTAFSGSTYGEAIIYLRVVQKEREICASRLNGIIEWDKTSAFHRITYYFKNSQKPCYYRAFLFHLISRRFILVYFFVGIFDGIALPIPIK